MRPNPNPDPDPDPDPNPKLRTVPASWVPIPVNDAFDTEDKQGAKGMPLKPCWAMSIHKSQGMSVGDGKPLERLRMAIDPAISMESKNLGLIYVAMSRTEKDANWVLHTRGIDEVQPHACSPQAAPFHMQRASSPFAACAPQGRLRYVNRHPHMEGRRAEDARLAAQSAATLLKYQDLDNEQARHAQHSRPRHIAPHHHRTYRTRTALCTARHRT